MHGCGRGSGGQPGNQNSLKHGAYAALAQLERLMKRMEDWEERQERGSAQRGPPPSKRD